MGAHVDQHKLAKRHFTLYKTNLVIPAYDEILFAHVSMYKLKVPTPLACSSGRPLGNLLTASVTAAVRCDPDECSYG